MHHPIFKSLVLSDFAATALTLDLVNNGRIGEVRSVLGFFSYFLRDPKNVRRVLDFGGGGLMDIGCYLVFTSRVIFTEEPSRVVSLIETDPETGTDILTSGILSFPSGHSVFYMRHANCPVSAGTNTRHEGQDRNPNTV
jgi:predicted dehydrogenase